MLYLLLVLLMLYLLLVLMVVADYLLLVLIVDGNTFDSFPLSVNTVFDHN